MVNTRATKLLRWNWSWLGLALGLVLLLLPLPPPSPRGWAPLLWNWAHALLFAWLGWSMMRAMLAHGHTIWRAAGWTAAIIVVLAVGMEGIQGWTGRQPDAADTGMDFVGAMAGMSAVGATTTRMLSLRLGLAALTVGLVLLSARDLILRGWVVAEKNAALPMLEDFENARSLALWFLEYDGAIVPLQRVADRSVPNHALRVQVRPHGLTSLHGDARDVDWSNAEHLVFDYMLEAAEPLTLGIRIDNAADARKRLQLVAILKPGSTKANVALPRDRSRREVLTAVGQLVLFVDEPGVSAAITFDNLRLEPRDGTSVDTGGY